MLIDIRELTPLADFFILVSAGNERTLGALADAVLESAREQFGVRGRLQGQASEGWMVVDFGTVMVHLFSPEKRELYNLEQLWERSKVLVRLR